MVCQALQEGIWEHGFPSVENVLAKIVEIRARPRDEWQIRQDEDAALTACGKQRATERDYALMRSLLYEICGVNENSERERLAQQEQLSEAVRQAAMKRYAEMNRRPMKRYPISPPPLPKPPAAVALEEQVNPFREEKTL